jgi:hypothetical protein
MAHEETCSFRREFLVHSGRIITYDEVEKNEHEFAPNVDQLTMDTPAPLQVGPDGRYPVPQPGILADHEY